uniref:Nucleotidyltransferase domain-containing protein n=1 Tax=Desulfacinum infernum TaxID=35837 RepID=A0A832EKU5_9BACT
MGFEVIASVYRKKAEHRERLRKDKLRRTLEALKKLSNDVPFEEVYVFGSITHPGRFTEHSDIDLAFKNLPKDALLSVTGMLSDALERDVNVCRLEELPFQDKVLKEGVRWRKGSEY